MGETGVHTAAIRVQPKQACIHPPIKIDDPLMMSYYKKLPPPVCEGEDWVYVDNGTLRFSKSVLKNYGNFTCDHYILYRINEREIAWGSPYVNIQDGYRIPTDFFKVKCQSEDNHTYDGIHAGVAYTHDRANRPEVDLSQGLDGLSVAIMGYDSMSRLSWLRRMPKTRGLFAELGAIELEGYNVIGDGTTIALLALLTGRYEWELPDSRINSPVAVPMDDYPLIWYDMKKAGYLTSWAEGLSGSFTWKLLGFNQQPTDFLTRPFFYAIKPWKEYIEPCTGSQRTSQVWLNYFRDIFLMYRNKRKFLLHFFSEFSHDNNNKMTEIDDELKDSIRILYDGGYLDNTLFILMGDHGARYGKLRSTWQGKMEERLPYFSFLFPKWFEEKYPKAIQNLRTNTHRLTTPFDIHETLKDFLRFGGTGVGNVSNRGISLFKEIPSERTCVHAQIASHWCACLAWEKVSHEDKNLQMALGSALDTINNFTSGFRQICAELAVEEITEAVKLKSSRALLQKIKDVTLYQITFHTTPGHGHFEVTVTHDVERNKMEVAGSEISRINKYGSDADCILFNGDIRQFCYCRSST
ncbi:uncharacterized protein LOC131942031 [Physella acuta]|uniref:uncharacterized protein LOC131942031 n=1 Tax=Physella acuta TaxID=109671 RepID=UPI0027DB16A5|nr:uncharacterized protein LOC131942031 [Physella acuta]